MRLHTLVVAGLLSTAAADAQIVSIADARDRPLGSVVTVQGDVTVPSGSYTSSTFDQGFAIEDGTAGIYVSTPDNLSVGLHRRVRVTGTLADDGFGQLVLRPAGARGVVKLGVGPRVRTGDVGEATEGLLVEVRGRITQGPIDDLPFGYKVFIDDGSGETQVFIPASTGINPFRIPFIRVGRSIRATGFSTQFEEQYEVLPRFRSDIQPAN